MINWSLVGMNEINLIKSCKIIKIINKKFINVRISILFVLVHLICSCSFSRYLVRVHTINYSSCLYLMRINIYIMSLLLITIALFQ
jgi:hypothetical protein